MGIVEALQQKSYTAKEQKPVSNFWKTLGIEPEELKWFTNKETQSERHHEQILIVRTPSEATGHKGISHGGLIATLLDETLCYGAYPVLPHHIGVTASLAIEYKAPTPAGSWIAIRSLAESGVGSRKATVDGQVYIIDLEKAELPWDSEVTPVATAHEIVVEPIWHDKLGTK